MSLYNALHGVNSMTPYLLKILNIDQEGGEYSSGRFRDIHVNANGSQIILLTRNGGGNRESYQEINDKLATHPEYIEDHDDDFDCTYAYFTFNVPNEHRKFCEEISTGKDPASISEKFSAICKEMEGMSKEQFEKDPRFAPLAKKIEEGINGKGGIVEI